MPNACHLSSIIFISDQKNLKNKLWKHVWTLCICIDLDIQWHDRLINVMWKIWTQNLKLAALYKPYNKHRFRFVLFVVVFVPASTGIILYTLLNFLEFMPWKQEQEHHFSVFFATLFELVNLGQAKLHGKATKLELSKIIYTLCAMNKHLCVLISNRPYDARVIFTSPFVQPKCYGREEEYYLMKTLPIQFWMRKYLCTKNLSLSPSHEFSTAQTAQDSYAKLHI